MVTASTRVANDDARLRRSPGRRRRHRHRSRRCPLPHRDQARRTGPDRLHGTWPPACRRLDHNHLRQGLADTRKPRGDPTTRAWAPPTSTGRRGATDRCHLRQPRTPDGSPRTGVASKGRRSAIDPGTSRNASDPINACLNYLYRLVEAEGHLATLAVGLDPGLGILHADVKGRPSFVLDLIEAVQPIADRHVLRLLRSPAAAIRDFHEDGSRRHASPPTPESPAGRGHARLPPQHRCSRWSNTSPTSLPWAARRRGVPSVLTSQKHRAAARRRSDRQISAPSVGPGAAGLAPRGKRRQKPSADLDAALPLPICRECGAALTPEPDRQRRRGASSASCLNRRRQQIGAGLPEAARRAHAEFSRETGISATHNPAVRARRQQPTPPPEHSRPRGTRTIPQRSPTRRGSERSYFRASPGSASDKSPTPLGCPPRRHSKVRAGRRLPHPRHWQSLAALLDTTDLADGPVGPRRSGHESDDVLVGTPRRTRSTHPVVMQAELQSERRAGHAVLGGSRRRCRRRSGAPVGACRVVPRFVRRRTAVARVVTTRGSDQDRSNSLPGEGDGSVKGHRLSAAVPPGGLLSRNVGDVGVNAWTTELGSVHGYRKHHTRPTGRMLLRGGRGRLRPRRSLQSKARDPRGRGDGPIVRVIRRGGRRRRRWWRRRVVRSSLPAPRAWLRVQALHRRLGHELRLVRASSAAAPKSPAR